jgi:hypothetical protein
VEGKALAAHAHERRRFAGAELPEGRRRALTDLDALLVAVRAHLESLAGHQRLQHEHARRRAGNGGSCRPEQRREDRTAHEFPCTVGHGKSVTLSQ